MVASNSLNVSTAVLYETDFMAWYEAQSALLRTQSYSQLDRINLLEELEDMGREQFRQTLSWVWQIIIYIHVLKLLTFPHNQACNHWWGTIAAFQDDLEVF